MSNKRSIYDSFESFGKRASEVVAGVNVPRKVSCDALPRVNIELNGRKISALLDTGTSITVIHSKHKSANFNNEWMDLTVAGRRVLRGKSGNVKLFVEDTMVDIKACFVDEIIPNVDVLLGRDVFLGKFW